jgi:hypothetical protein
MAEMGQMRKIDRSIAKDKVAPKADLLLGTFSVRA